MAVKIPFEHLSTIYTLIIASIADVTNRRIGTLVVSFLVGADISGKEILTIGEPVFRVVCLKLNGLTS